ncbi:MAG: PAS domain S-box protein [Syntrophaceae bacterium]|nr:PAS domain S-box protein [Syntrophaceae bacterium]
MSRIKEKTTGVIAKGSVPMAELGEPPVKAKGKRQQSKTLKSHTAAMSLLPADLSPAVLDQMTDLVVVTDSALSVIYANPAFYVVSGYGDSHTAKLSFDKILDPGSVPVIRRFLSGESRTSSSAAEEEHVSVKLTLCARDGHPVYLEAKLSVFVDTEKKMVLIVAREVVQQSRVAESLRLIEGKYQSLFESSNDAIMILDKSGFFDCNRKALEIFACPSKESFTTFHPSDLSPPFQPDGESSIDAANRMIDLTLEQGNHAFSWLHRRMTGELFPAEVSMSRFELGGKWVVQSVVRDETDRQRAEEEIQKSERRLADILDFLPDPTFAVDPEGHVIAWNRAMEKLTGVSGRDMLDKGDYEYAIPFYRKRRPLMIDILLKSKPEEVKNYRKAHWEEGALYYENDEAIEVGKKMRYLWSKASLIYDHNDQVVGAIQTIRDITERKEMDLTMMESERKFRTLFESSNDAIMMLDKRSFFDCNEKTLEIYGFRSKEEFVKFHPGEVSPAFQPDGEPSVEKANRHIDIALEKGSYSFTWIHKKTDGTLFPAEVLLSRFELGGRAVVQAVVRDITERVQGELALKRSKEELEVKSAYLEEANTALKVLLRRREEDKADLQEDVLANMRTLVHPYIERLKQILVGSEQQAYLQVLESNLNNIASPFLRNITLAHFNLTGREIQIANLVKEGKTNKEMAEMLNLSVRSVEFHRDNIRKKMKLDHRKANLRVYLLSLS